MAIAEMTQVTKVRKKRYALLPQIQAHIIAHQLANENPLLMEKIHLANDGKYDSIEGLTETIKYLDAVHIASQENQKCSPSVIVDNVWHEFILFTKTYTDFCQDRYGRMIHHNPGIKQSDKSNFFGNSIKYIKLYYNEVNQTFWPIMEIGADCGGCDGSGGSCNGL